MTDGSTPLADEVAQHVSRQQAAADDVDFAHPAQTRVLVVANQKGGVGKTTSAVNIAAALAMHGQHVLLVDLDPQGNASTALGIEHSEGTPGVYEALVDGSEMTDLVKPCSDIENLSVLPASIDLAGAEIELVSLVARESRLNRSLTRYLDSMAAQGHRIDYVFIDCPPSLGLLTVNALVAGRELLIPIQCEYYALEGLGQLIQNVDLIKAHLNPDLEITTVLLTMHDARTRLSAGVADEVRNYFGDRVLRTAVPRSVRISEAPSYQQSVMTYDPNSPGSLTYLEAAREIAERGAGSGPAGSPEERTSANVAAPAATAAPTAAADPPGDGTGTRDAAGTADTGAGDTGTGDTGSERATTDDARPLDTSMGDVSRATRASSDTAPAERAARSTAPSPRRTPSDAGPSDMAPSSASLRPGAHQWPPDSTVDDAPTSGTTTSEHSKERP